MSKEVLSTAQIREYAASMDAKEFPYFCAVTGEVAENLAYVIRESIRDFYKCGVTHRWKRTRIWQHR